jgi:AcrR family transcriptional regulator
MERYSSRVADVKDRRALAAERTQREIVEAASRLFLADGYAATSIAAIAREAGVAVQTIYNAIGAKRDVLSRVLDYAAAGDHAPTPVPTFMREQAERETDPRRVVDLLVGFWLEGLRRTAPVFGVIRQAAAVDPEVAALERERAAQRLRNYGQAARQLQRLGGLRDGVGLEDAAAVIHAVGHPDEYRFLVLEQGWEPERWGAWVRATLVAALLPPG